MQDNKLRSRRNIEVATGFFILLTAFGYIFSILLDFNFVSPYTTLLEDLSYLLDHDETQRLSSYAWLLTSVLTLLSIPFYILTFHKKLKWLHYFSALFLLAASACFFITGWLGLQFSESISIALTDNISNLEDSVKLQLLNEFNEEQYFKRIASTCIGIFVIFLGMSRFKIRAFPLFSTLFFFIGGPVLIFFNWYDTNHILRTSAMAVIAVGIIIFGIRLIYSGLTPRNKSVQVEN